MKNNKFARLEHELKAFRVDKYQAKRQNKRIGFSKGKSLHAHALDNFSFQSSFNSTISIKHSYLKSRVFKVKGKIVKVTIDSHWIPPKSNNIRELYVVLTHVKDYWFDSNKGEKTFAIGKKDTKTWTELTPGNYYLEFHVADTNPHTELKGTIEVIV